MTAVLVEGGGPRQTGLSERGDLRVQLTRQVTTAVGDATTAAIAVEKYLSDRKAQVGV